LIRVVIVAKAPIGGRCDRTLNTVGWKTLQYCKGITLV
jgi:hypothetical protein